jgi:hypothetical protein
MFNRIKTFMLMPGITAPFGVIGAHCGGVSGLFSPHPRTGAPNACPPAPARA